MSASRSTTRIPRRTVLKGAAAGAAVLGFPLPLRAQGPVFKVGVVHPVTGPLAEPGQACRLGATMAAVLPESNEPMSIWAPWLITRSASVRPTSGLVCVSPKISSSFAPPMDLMPPAALTASAAMVAPRRQA